MNIEKIRVIKDFPIEGVDFLDITTLLGDAQAFKETFDELLEKAQVFRPDVIVALESRGYFFGPALALALNIPFVPIRKKGKLPYKVFSADYALEYGMASIEIHQDAITENKRVLILDDILATGGTAAAAVQLVKNFNPSAVELFFLIELSFLNGREKLKDYSINSLLIK